jgi:hypothetical protein
MSMIESNSSSFNGDDSALNGNGESVHCCPCLQLLTFFFSIPSGERSFLAGHGVPTDRKHYIGIYSPQARKIRIKKFIEKRKYRMWSKKVKYDVRKSFADSRVRVKGRFVKKSEDPTAGGGGSTITTTTTTTTSSAKSDRQKS